MGYAAKWDHQTASIGSAAGHLGPTADQITVKVGQDITIVGASNSLPFDYVYTITSDDPAIASAVNDVIHPIMAGTSTILIADKQGKAPGFCSIGAKKKCEFLVVSVVG